MTSCETERVISAAREYAAAHDPDPEHSEQVARNARDLFELLQDLHGLGGKEWPLLHLAALLHDTGLRLNPESHHKASRDVIMQAPLEGLSPGKRMMVACIARYHRKALPDKKHKIYRDLSAKQRIVVGKLAALLRVADGLDRSHAGSVAGMAVEIIPDAVLLKVKQRFASPIDLDAAQRKADLFERVYGLPLQIE
jgi:exopolyphosphatase / guanosine-5'-triphosphate,3'-diphosphate pyrophosphatase